MPSSACGARHRDLGSFPTRRSSDLCRLRGGAWWWAQCCWPWRSAARCSVVSRCPRRCSIGCSDWGWGRWRLPPSGSTPWRMRKSSRDRKSTRLNSSHSQISYAVFCMRRAPPGSRLFPYTTLFRSMSFAWWCVVVGAVLLAMAVSGTLLRRLPLSTAMFYWLLGLGLGPLAFAAIRVDAVAHAEIIERSEEHTSELQSQSNIVCRLLHAARATGISALSLHDALPIYVVCVVVRGGGRSAVGHGGQRHVAPSSPAVHGDVLLAARTGAGAVGVCRHPGRRRGACGNHREIGRAHV